MLELLMLSEETINTLGPPSALERQVHFIAYPSRPCRQNDGLESPSYKLARINNRPLPEPGCIAGRF